MSELVRLERLCKAYPNQENPAVDNVSLSIDKGSVYGLIGRNGSGKSSLARILTGVLRPNSGHVWINEGRDAAATADWQRSNVAYLSQSPLALNTMTVKESMTYFGRLYGTKSSKKQQKRLLEKLGILRFHNQEVRSLSGGQSKLVQLAIAISSNRPFVILDEPTNELDTLNRRLVWNEIANLSQEGVTILVITHAVSEAESCLTHLGVMDKGRLIANGTVDQIMQEIQNRRTIAYRTESNTDKGSAPWEQIVDVDQVPRIISKLYLEGAEDITISSPSLEDVFVNLVASKTNKA
ncbi:MULTISPECIES: ABC transporter ATP-binding protein [Corynebacterium]|uniref:ABC transporter ATP-binding protein n=1 Tax=Corynebacterium TaxID=1716 RepID=UPI00254E53A0|nr:ABC transporter ATP-binding protein [Corynebacterium sp. MSK156]MDK8786600.1 ABC transporter ATP-binding protein [Corynebacterium sp. MSK156]